MKDCFSGFIAKRARSSASPCLDLLSVMILHPTPHSEFTDISRLSQRKKNSGMQEEGTWEIMLLTGVFSKLPWSDIVSFKLIMHVKRELHRNMTQT